MYIYIIFLLLCLFWYYKPIRFYIFSYFFVFLNENENIGKFLGIKYANDYELNILRKDTHIYFPGIITKIIEFFINYNIELKVDEYKKFVKIQHEISKKINLSNYINNLDNKIISIDDFEDLITKSYLIEINKIYSCLNDEEFNYFYTNNNITRRLLNSLTNNIFDNLIFIIKNFYTIYKFRNILLKIHNDYRHFYIVTQLTIINKITEMIIFNMNSFNNLELWNFLISSSKFYTIINNNNLYIIRRNIDKTNNYTNKGFGVKGHQCPAAMLVCEIFNNIILNFKNYNIKIIGTVKYSSQKRFLKNIINKQNVYFHFTKITN